MISIYTKNTFKLTASYIMLNVFNSNETCFGMVMVNTYKHFSYTIDICDNKKNHCDHYFTIYHAMSQ